MRIIGFGHKARQGKNTAALAYLEACPLDANTYMCSYADALRKEVQKACIQYGSAAKLIDAWKESGNMPEWVHPEAGKERTLFQFWGTDFRRAQDADYWVKKLSATLTRLNPELVLVTDVRFENEAQFIKSKGGVLVRVVRTSEPDVNVPEHPSEQALDGFKGWDYTLTAATVAELKTKTRALYESLSALEVAK